MTREFITLPSFDVKWKSLGLDEDDKSRLEQELLDNPKIGPVMQGTGGVRKMRFAFRDRGKSGSDRKTDPGRGSMAGCPLPFRCWGRRGKSEGLREGFPPVSKACPGG